MGANEVLPVALPDDVEKEISDAGWWLVRADMLVRSDPSFSDTLGDKLRAIARRAQEDAVVTPNQEQANRLAEINDALYTAAGWLDGVSERMLGEPSDA